VIEYADPKKIPPDSRSARTVRRLSTMLWQGVVAALLPGFVVCAVIFWLAGPNTQFLGWFTSSLAIQLGVLLGLLTALLLFVTARTVQMARHRRAMIVLAHLETVVRAGLPLAQTLRNWRDSESEGVARLLSRVAEALEDGAPIAEALVSARADLPWRVIDRLAAAERAGRIVPAITEVLAHERRRQQRDPVHWPFVKTYAIVLLMCVPGIIMVLSIFVMPKFQQIMKDFHQPPPASMMWVIAISRGVAPLVTTLGVILFLVAGQVAVEQLGRPNMRPWQLRHGLMRTMIGHLRWMLPIVGTLDRDRGMADVMGTVAEALEAHRPLHLAVAEAHQPHLNAVLAERVNQWGQGIAAGLSPGAAAARAGLPAIVSGMLGTKHPAPNVAGVCRFLERYYRSRFSRLETLIRESGVPILALCGGAAVVLVALAIFQPIIVLLQSVLTFKVRP